MSEYQKKHNAEEDEENTSYPYVVSVKFRNAGRAYSFGTEDPGIQQGDWVVVETSQGMELGECETAAVSTARYPVPMALKPILRVADSRDKEIYEENFELADEAYSICSQEIKDLNLQMRLLSADYTLDRSKILFVYLSEQRVDFRELLKRLGSRLHCRIELRQIGERDKAKMVGGIGMCGMECCCSRFKNRFDVISISMAKNQLLALNVEKLSGQCGKLMCCLKYENENYKQLTEGLPKMGAHVEYEGSLYKVTSMNVMTNEARIENAETVQNITIEDLRTKCEVKKGVAMQKRQPGRGGKRTVINNMNQNAAKVEDKLHETLHRQVASRAEEVSPLSYAGQAAFAGHTASVGGDVNGSKPVGGSGHGNGNGNGNGRRGGHGNKNAKPQQQAQPQKNSGRSGQSQKGGNSGNSGRRNNQPKHLTASKDNPNMTVRSFKSSKTKAQEAAAGQKDAGK